MLFRYANWMLVVLFCTNSQAYYDAGTATFVRQASYTLETPTEVLYTAVPETLWDPPPMSTGVAAVTTLVGGGHNVIFEVYYTTSIAGAKRRIVNEYFKRAGVLADEPPIPTCRQCGPGGEYGIETRPYTSVSSISGRPACTTRPFGYSGVLGALPNTRYCFESTYTGVFSTYVYSDYTLSCCITTGSCRRPNSTATTQPSYTFSSGVFASTTTYTSNNTVSTFTAPSSVVFTPVSTPGSPSGTGGNGQGPAGVSSSTRTSLTTTSPSSASNSRISTATYSIFVISSTTITISASTRSSTAGTTGPSQSSPSASSGSAASSSSSSVSVLTMITPSSTRSSASLSTLLASVTTSRPGDTTTSATLTGCGTVASGSGTVIGSGTVYYATIPPLFTVSSGTAIGSAILLVGCGTMIGTGTFTGTATITGCGSGNGTATLTGIGTVYPSIGGTLRTDISYVTSGIITGSGSVRGCGTLTGSGTFTVTGGYTTTQSLVTVTQIVSYCGPSAAKVLDFAALDQLAANGSTPSTAPGPNYLVDAELRKGWNSTNGTESQQSLRDPQYPISVGDILKNMTSSARLGLAPNTTFSNSTISNSTTNETLPFSDYEPCNECPNSAGICCPGRTQCDEMGKCPWATLEGIGYLRGGKNMVMARNLSDGSMAPDDTVRPEDVGLPSDARAIANPGSGEPKRISELLDAMAAEHANGGGDGGDGKRVEKRSEPAAAKKEEEELGDLLLRKQRELKQKREAEEEMMMQMRGMKKDKRERMYGQASYDMLIPGYIDRFERPLF